jgi:cytochrome c oxidase subunit 2
MSEVPEGAVPIAVTARMWAFSFQYPNGLQTDTLYVPVRQAIKLSLTSVDVNHSMYIPAFRIKKDVIPNRTNVMWFSTPEAKSYDVACAEYCGLRHAYMYTKVVALEPGKFDEWYRKASASASKPYAPLVQPAAVPR